MSSVIYEHIKKYPDFYVDKEPAIVRELPNRQDIALQGGNKDYTWFMTADTKQMYFLPKEGDLLKKNQKVFVVNLSDKGYSTLLEVHGISSKCIFIPEPNEL